MDTLARDDVKDAELAAQIEAKQRAWLSSSPLFTECKRLRAELAERRAAAQTWENEAERRSRRYEQAAVELDSLRAELAVARENEQRYLWLSDYHVSDPSMWTPGAIAWRADYREELIGETFDAAIDAAIKGES